MELEKKVIEYFDNCFVNRDYEGTVSLFSDEITCYGTGRGEYCDSYDELCSAIRKEFTALPGSLFYEIYDMFSYEIDSHHGQVIARIKMETTIENQNLVFNDIRASFVLRKEEKGWLITQIHLSTPHIFTQDDETYPLKEIEDRETIINRLIESEKKAIKKLNSSIANEIKKPLTEIQAEANELKEKISEIENPKISHLYGLLISSVDKTNELIDGLSQYTNLEVYNVHEYVSLNEVVEDVRELLFNLILVNDAKIKVKSVLPTIKSNKTVLVNLMQNIINNAIKYSKPDIAPIIEISFKTENNYHIISIKDNGLGIKEENHEKVFKLFKRANKRDKVEGTGIGLSMCKKNISNLNGKISLDSTFGEGSTFHLHIPVNQ